MAAGWLKSERGHILTTSLWRPFAFSLSFNEISMFSRHKFALSMAFSVSVRCSCNPSSSKNDLYSSLARSSSLSASSILAASSRSFLQLQRDFRRLSATLIRLVSIVFWRDNLLLAFLLKIPVVRTAVPNKDTHVLFVEILYVVGLMIKFFRWHFNTQTLHIKWKFIKANVQCYVPATSGSRRFHVVSRSQTVNFSGPFILNKRQQRNRTRQLRTIQRSVDHV